MKKRSLHRLIALPLVAAALTWTAQANAAGCGSGAYYQDNTHYNTQQTPGYPTGNPPGVQPGYPQGYQQPGYQGQQYQHQGQNNPNYQQGAGTNPNYQGGYNQGASTYNQTTYANEGRNGNGSGNGNNNGNGDSGSFWDRDDSNSGNGNGNGSSYTNRRNDGNRTYRNNNNNGNGNGSSSFWERDNSRSNNDRSNNEGNGNSNGTYSESTTTTTQQYNQGAMVQNQSGGTILDMIANNPQYSTFNKLIQASPDFMNALRGNGPYTVFAPTNAAFNKLSSSKIQDLTKPENKDKLRKVLSFHVVSGKYMTTDLKDDLKTLNGDSLGVEVDNNTVTIDDAKIVQPNMVASNGVIQGIDTVLMP